MEGSGLQNALKYELQDKFWKSIISKYELRIAEHEEIITVLQNRVDKLDAILPAILSFYMAKLAQQNPQLNLNELKEFPCSQDQLSLHKTVKLPDLTNTNVFDIRDEDIKFMEQIKDLSKIEKKHLEEVKRLKSKEKSLKNVHKYVEDILETRESSLGNLKAIKNRKLLEENRKFMDEITNLKDELKGVKNDVELRLPKQVDRERRKIFEYESCLVTKANGDQWKCLHDQKDIARLKMQLESCEKSLLDIMEVNDRLKLESDFLEKKMIELRKCDKCECNYGYT